MTINDSFEAFWLKSGFKKINKTKCKAEYEAIVSEENIQANELESFTDKMIAKGRARLRFIRTQTGHLSGEVHPLTWLRNREHNEEPNSELSKKQRPITRELAELSKKLKNIEGTIALFDSEEGNEEQRKKLVAEKRQLEDKIAEIKDTDK